jgi:hypothetical protein
MTVLCLWQALTTYRCWDRLKITGGRELSSFGPTQPLSCYLSACDFLPALASLLRFLRVLWRIILTCAQPYLHTTKFPYFLLEFSARS